MQQDRVDGGFITQQRRTRIITQCKVSDSKNIV